MDHITGLAEVPVEDGAIGGEGLAARVHRRGSAEPWRGYAGGPPTIFALVAMACGISGAFLGEAALPRAWRWKGYA